jgi:hypothetical protein
MWDIQDLEVGRRGGGGTLNGEDAWDGDKAAVGTVEALTKIPSFTLNVDSRMRSDWISSLRCLLISRSISGVMASAWIEDPAGGESLTPRREDFEGGTGAGGAVGLDDAPGAEGLPAL